MGAGHKTLADKLQAFDKINSLLARLKLSRLDDGAGIEATLYAITRLNGMTPADFNSAKPSGPTGRSLKQNTAKPHQAS